jgi:hypothetical protein
MTEHLFESHAISKTHALVVFYLGMRPHAFISFSCFETLVKHLHSFLKYYYQDPKNAGIKCARNTVKLHKLFIICLNILSIYNKDI